MRSILRYLLIFGVLVLYPIGAFAHEVRPGLLQLQETSPDQFDMFWRVPARGDLALLLTPQLPENCATLGLPENYDDGMRREEKRSIVCTNGLADARIGIDGLERVQTDVLISVSYIGDGSETLRATPQNPSVILEGQRSLMQVAATYFALGVEHILSGIDHLLFVAALLFLVTGWRRLLGTVTAFTVAHSITLAGASMGVLSASPVLIEALIALSIVAVAAEVVLVNRGETGIATRRPWLIAFGFGLLHGLGFAGALREIGLPADAVPAALLFFNLGVEAGQVTFIAGLMIVLWVARSIVPVSEIMVKRVAPVIIGIMAGFWATERMLAIWA